MLSGVICKEKLVQKLSKWSVVLNLGSADPAGLGFSFRRFLDSLHGVRVYEFAGERVYSMHQLSKQVCDPQRVKC